MIDIDNKWKVITVRIFEMMYIMMITSSNFWSFPVNLLHINFLLLMIDDWRLMIGDSWGGLLSNILIFPLNMSTPSNSLKLGITDTSDTPHVDLEVAWYDPPMGPWSSVTMGPFKQRKIVTGPDYNRWWWKAVMTKFMMNHDSHLDEYIHKLMVK